MSNRFRISLITLIIAALACNMPTSNNASVGATLTAAVATSQVLISSTPSGGLPTITFPTLPPVTAAPTGTSVPPTAIQPPTLTPIPCNAAAFVKDVTYPDGADVLMGQSFTKTWRFKNMGSCAWNSGYQLVFDHGEQMGGPANQSLTSGSVNPSQTVDISVNLTAPSSSGTHRGYWMLRDSSGVLFGLNTGAFWVEIKSIPPTFTPTFTPSPTLTPAIVFQVTGVTLSVSGSCGSFHINADVTTNAAGSVTYHWIRSDGATDTAAHPSIVFGAAGTQSVATDWSVSASGPKWMDIYIDTPNNHQFGRADFSCP
jgi:hypothetical protein